MSRIAVAAVTVVGCQDRLRTMCTLTPSVADAEPPRTDSGPPHRRPRAVARCPARTGSAARTARSTSAAPVSASGSVPTTLLLPAPRARVVTAERPKYGCS
ncbi:hypothetical protein ACWD4G_33690 [Streptomyces sp. NPDC002643]